MDGQGQLLRDGLLHELGAIFSTSQQKRMGNGFKTFWKNYFSAVKIFILIYIDLFRLHAFYVFKPFVRKYSMLFDLDVIYELGTSYIDQ